MDEKLEALFDELEKKAVEPQYYRYFIKDANQIIRKHFEQYHKQELEKVMTSEDEDIERSGIAYDYLSGKGVFKDMNPQHQIDIQEALRMSAGTHGYKQSLQPTYQSVYDEFNRHQPDKEKVATLNVTSIEKHKPNIYIEEPHNLETLDNNHLKKA